MTTKIISLWLCILLLSGCTLIQSTSDKGLEGTWQLYDITLKDESELSFSASVDLKKDVKEGSMLSFFADNSFTEMDGPGKFTTGKWDTNGGAVELTGANANAKSATLAEEKNNAGNAYASLQVERGGRVLKYRKIAGPLKLYKDDPFYGANNEWRTKPTKAEDQKELTQRLAAYIKHLALVLKAAKDRKQDVVSFEYSKGPVKIYNGGIGIYPYEMVPAEWKSGFYNDSSAQAAYGLYERYLRTGSYKGTGIGDWVVDDYNILISAYADLIK